MKTFLLYVLTLNAQTGDLIDSHPDPEYVQPMLAQDCIAATVAKGPQPVRDGKATIYVCYNLSKSTSKVTI
jgi:hypothetical protein